MKFVQQRGVVLIVVLWITVLLTVLLVAFTATIKVDRHVASDIIHRVQARAGAEAVLSYLVAIQQSGAYDWPAMVGPVYKLDINAMQVRFRVIPESAFISLNAAPVEDLLAIFNALGVDNASDIAQLIVQRRKGYFDEKSGEAVKPQPWISTIELSRYPEIPQVLSQRVQDWFTSDSDHQEVNLGFADVSLVRALKGDEADQLLSERALRTSNNQSQQLDGDIYRVQVELSVGASIRKIEATAEFNSDEHGYHVVRWNEYNARFSLD
jgi:hypothetical protein